MIRSPSRTGRQERQTNFKVVIRIRPPLPRELSGEIPFKNVVAVDRNEQCITISENIEAVIDSDGNVLTNTGPYTTYSFMFDYVYDLYCSQEKVYDTTARSVVDSALQGYNATIFAYGQTGAGKTYTMEGFNRDGGIESRGIIPRAIEQIFGHIQSYASSRKRFLVRASYIQIYNEQISDLLKPERKNLAIREDKRKGVHVEGLSEWVVRSPPEIYGLMERGAAARATGETKMNEMSSRSHAVFVVIVEQSETSYVDDRGQEMTPEEFQKFMHQRGVHREQEFNRLEDHVRQTFKVGKLNLVDLAGSERVERSGATGKVLGESIQINKSLTMLGYVISALTEAKDRSHVPYRNSKLTRMLEDSLGGNCKTTMMAMISPAFEAMLETISTLKFANRAKNIRNEAKVNEDLDQKSLLRKYELELKKLRAELEEKSKNVVDKRRLLELDEQRKRAEADKVAALRALEARSLEFMKEKEEKKKLEQRIRILTSQMIRGDTGAMKHLLNESDVGELLNESGEMVMREQQEKLRQEYEHKLADLERERETIEEEKAQVDRYKQLLLKQRDIMIALTQRLVERDEQITALQDELDAYDHHQKDLEEKLDARTAELIKLRRISEEVNAASPYKSEELKKALEKSWTEDQEKPKTDSHIDDMTEVDPDGGEEIHAYKPDVPHSKHPKHQGHHHNKANDEKAKELQRVVDQQQQQIRSLETRLLQQSNPSPSIDTRRLQELDLQIQQLKEENKRLKLNVNTNVEDSNLQLRCDTLVKEREAVQTIMEQKIKVLVQSVAQSANDIIQNNSLEGSPMVDSMIKNMTALQRMVNASIAALKNAANNQPSSNTSTPRSVTPTGSIPPPPPFSGSGLTPTFASSSNNSFNYSSTGGNINQGSRYFP